MARLFITTALFCCALSFASAQDASTPAHSDTNSLESLQHQAAERATAWSQLAASLEPRIARMLPCDERVQAAIDETNKASEARLAAAAKYWRALGAKSGDDGALLNRLLREEQARSADWTRDHSDAEQERISVDAHVVALKASAARAPSLGQAEKLMESIAASTQQMAERAGQRETGSATFADELRESIRQVEFLRGSAETKLATVNAESSVWGEYYAARGARARAECVATNPDAPRSRRTTLRTNPPGSPKPGNGGN